MQLDYAATERTGGLCAGANQRPRWVRIFSITSGCSMSAIKVGLETRGKVAIDEENALIYWGSETGCIYCANIETGQLVWKRHVGTRLFTNPEIVGNDLVFSTVSSRIFCMDRFSNSIKWYYNTRDRVFSITSTQDGRVYCGSMDKHLYVIGLETGSLIKKWYVGNNITTSPVIIGNRAYLGGQGSIFCAEIDGA